MRSASRAPGLDLYRGIACTMVVVYHLNGGRPIGLGQAAMELFFVLSGYLISRSLVRSVAERGYQGLREFAWRRICRLMPAMVGFLLGALLLNACGSAFSWSQFNVSAVAALTGWYNYLQAWREPVVLGFGGIWSLSLEEQFYLAAVGVILVLRLLTREPRHWLAILALGLLVGGAAFRIAAYLGAYQPPTGSYLSYLPPLRMWGFGFGVLLAAVEPRGESSRRLRPWAALAVVLGCVAAIWALIASVEEYSPRSFLLQWALIPAIGCVAIGVVPSVDPLLQEQRGVLAWSWGALRLVGLASYSIYLWHCLVVSAFVHFHLFGSRSAWWAMLGLSFASGLLSWYFIERRFYRFAPVRDSAAALPSRREAGTPPI